MADGRLERLFWRVLDDLDYLVALAWLRNLDVLAGPSRGRRPIDSGSEIGSG